MIQAFNQVQLQRDQGIRDMLFLLSGTNRTVDLLYGRQGYIEPNCKWCVFSAHELMQGFELICGASFDCYGNNRAALL